MSRARRPSPRTLTLLLLAATAVVAAPPPARSQTTEPPTAADAAGPPPEPWAAQPPEKWPQILLQDQVTVKGFDPTDGVGGFLMKLADGPVVGVTTVAGGIGGVDVADLKGTVSRWVLHPPQRPGQAVALRQPVLPPEQAKAMNCAMLAINPTSAPPAAVLAAATATLRPGQTVYLVGWADGGEKPGQTIYKGEVTELNHRQPGAIAFTFPVGHDVKPNTFGGCPLLDDAGHVVGLVQGYYPEGTTAETVMGMAFQMPLLLAEVRVPPELAKAAPAAARPHGGTDDAPHVAPSPAAAPAAASADAAARSRALHTAEAYVAADRYDLARRKLQDVVTTYPGTPAAKQAQTDLDQIQGK